MINLLLLLVVAAVCGSVGAALAGRKGTGCLGSIALGLIGALLGRQIAVHLHLPRLLSIGDFPVVWSVMGSALFVALLTLLGGRPSKSR